tara:strand:- start:1401 stop:2147 length:747 start_codon:yes stop_codon:yes gene_type:complete
MIERDISTIGELIDAIRSDQDDEKGAVWFRGQSDAEWKLLPGFLRLNAPISETTFLNRFKQSASMLADRRPESSFDWMFLMQHYGVPTRLLDWSESPLVALYFAIEKFSDKPGVDAALWSLWPTMLNRNANIHDNVEGNYIPSFDDAELESYTIERLRAHTRVELYPVATIATRNSARIQAQLGTFTIHHKQPVPIEAVGDTEHIARYRIPHEAMESMLNELRILGFNRFGLFPELASIGEMLRSALK